MKKAPVNVVMSEAKPPKAKARLAEAGVARHSYSKAARQAAFIKLAHHLPVAEAVSRAKLIPAASSAKFRIVRMPG